MIVGFPPFCAETPEETYRKIMNWRDTLRIPPECEVSPEAESLIRGLLCERDERLSLDEIKAHPFFAGLDWSTLREQRSFFRPRLASPMDTRYFREQAEQLADEDGDDEEDEDAAGAHRTDVTSLFSQSVSAEPSGAIDTDRERNWAIDLPFIG